MGTIRRLWPHLRPYWRLVLIAPALMVLEVAMDLTQPYLIRQIVDFGIPSGDIGLILRTGALMVGAALVGAVGGIGCTYFAVRAALRFGADLRSALYRHVQGLSLGNFDVLGTGSLITRLTSDVTQVQDIVLMALRIMVRAPLIMIGSLIMAIVTSPRLGVLFVVLIPPLAVVIYVVLVRSYPLYQRLQLELDRLNTIMQENLAGVRVVKAFVRAEHETGRFDAQNEALVGSSIRAMEFSATVTPVMTLVLNLGVAAVIWWGGQGAMNGDITLGEIIAFVNYLRQTLFSLVMVSMLFTRISRAQASADRIIEVLDSAPQVQERPTAATSPAQAGRLAFEGVSFSYDTGEPVLHDVTFTAESGQTVAILGATGAGKSSLVNLIPRFYEVSAGRITLGGVDIRDMSLKALRQQVGFALQESVLFSGTVFANLLYGRDDAAAEEVYAAARAAQADDFVRGFPEGYDTQLGQRGVNLSGGQRQRLAIARALVRRPAVLVLDDSTSAVDVETETQIHTAMDALLQHTCTRIIVAQRISTVLDADKILVLERGQIVAEGTHASLLDSSPIYREIYESQLGNGATTPVTEAAHGQSQQ